MKFVFLILILTTYWSHAFAKRKNLTQSEALYQEKLKRLQKDESTMDHFARVKYYMINGEIDLAKHELYLIQADSNVSSILKQRYLAIIAFIEGDYKASDRYLDEQTFISDEAFSRICVMKIFNQMVLNKTNQLYSTFNKCSLLNRNFSKGFEWLSQLIRLKMQDKKIFEGKDFALLKGVGDYDTLRVWLKLAIYLNKEDLIIPIIPDLPETAYENKEIRELIGLIYYRKQKFKSAFNFVEDLNSPNTENIKGNIYLDKKFYELAYGQFKLALSKKQNSYNAIERSISLAWILNQYQDGIDLSERLVFKESNEAQRLTLQSAFLVGLDKYEEAGRRLERAQSFFPKNPPKELTQLYSYVALMLEDRHFLKRYIQLSCESLDGFSCWLALENQQWENFAKTVKRDEELNFEKEFSVSQLREKVELDPIQGPKRIDQRDIEELDEEYIRLTKK
jgi:hypothetical protein